MLIFYQMLTDVHAHLHMQDFDNDRDDAIQRAWDADVKRIINVSFDVEGGFRAIAIAKKYDWIYATMGVHPHTASEWNDQVGAKMLETAKNEEKVVAIGEIGLDYYKNFQPEDVQKRTLLAQLAVARELELPVIIHCRDAFRDIFKILSQEKIERVLLHCFTGSEEIASEAWKKGYGTSFTGIITYPSANSLREVAAACPEDKIFFETDCPYLAPQSKRGQRNEPAFVREVADCIAKIRGIPAQSLESSVIRNVKTLFGV